ncbi:MAG: hypothetical protein AUG89_06820 [Acidobacteria bacterium 13_1_20CM_4_56_7]|nr:MAG: hypothetical protein AUG89_06820 [Acidobacteria bacterium 13_1_20CM_4_56_7]
MDPQIAKKDSRLYHVESVMHWLEADGSSGITSSEKMYAHEQSVTPGRIKTEQTVKCGVSHDPSSDNL